MKKIKLSQNKYALVDDGDYDYLNEWKWSFSDMAYGGKAYRKEGTKGIYMHRQIMEAPTTLEVDHINHNTLDNRRANLRLATRSQNAANRRVQINNVTGVKGVYYDKRRDHWIAYAKKDGKRYYAGSFSTILDAARAYNKLAFELHGEYGYALS